MRYIVKVPIIHLVLFTSLMFLNPVLVRAQDSQILNSHQSQKFFEESMRRIEKKDRISRLFTTGVSREELLAVAMENQKWSIAEHANGNIYSIDRGYGDVEEEEYLSLAIAESTNNSNFGKLVGLNVSLPLSVSQDEGVFVSFCELQEVGDKVEAQCAREKSFVAGFSECNKEMNMCLATFRDMKIAFPDAENHIDIAEAVGNSDSVEFYFKESDVVRNVTVSLQGFKSRYKNK